MRNGGFVNARVLFVGLLLLTGSAFAEGTVDLLEYMQTHIEDQAKNTSIPKYNRAKHFGGWIRQNTKKSCRDTRATVLERDADEGATPKYSANGCTVTEGRWHDPYTDQDFSIAKELQIDHVVPLKNAYLSGAHGWTPSQRCHYANFLGNGFHLRAVNAHENMSKGDSSPDEYMPPNDRGHCNYLNTWMKVKVIWQLTATEAEVQTIKLVMDQVHCGKEYRYMDESHLDEQRGKASEPIAVCENFGD